MKIYVFVYNDDTSLYFNEEEIISYHLTKEGAERAMESHKAGLEQEYNISYTEAFKRMYPFGLDKTWNIEEIEVKP